MIVDLSWPVIVAWIPSRLADSKEMYAAIFTFALVSCPFVALGTRGFRPLFSPWSAGLDCDIEKAPFEKARSAGPGPVQIGLATMLSLHRPISLVAISH
jgi:hypothetical protein